MSKTIWSILQKPLTARRATFGPYRDLEAFQENSQVQDAVVRNIEIIGEAVSRIQKIAPDFIKQHSELPWAQMRGMRNIAIHEYFFVDLEIVWKTVKNDLPKLKQRIDALKR